MEYLKNSEQKTNIIWQYRRYNTYQKYNTKDKIILDDDVPLLGYGFKDSVIYTINKIIFLMWKPEVRFILNKNFRTYKFHFQQHEHSE
jgi:hypothetical protein